MGGERVVAREGGGREMTVHAGRGRLRGFGRKAPTTFPRWRARALRRPVGERGAQFRSVKGAVEIRIGRPLNAPNELAHVRLHGIGTNSYFRQRSMKRTRLACSPKNKTARSHLPRRGESLSPRLDRGSNPPPACPARGRHQQMARKARQGASARSGSGGGVFCSYARPPRYRRASANRPVSVRVRAQTHRASPKAQRPRCQSRTGPK